MNTLHSTPTTPPFPGAGWYLIGFRGRTGHFIETPPALSTEVTVQMPWSIRDAQPTARNFESIRIRPSRTIRAICRNITNVSVITNPSISWRLPPQCARCTLMIERRTR